MGTFSVFLEETIITLNLCLYLNFFKYILGHGFANEWTYRPEVKVPTPYLSKSEKILKVQYVKISVQNI